MRDQYLQEWRASLMNSPKLNYYSNFKFEFGFEDYLNIIQNDTLRKQLSCFRLSSHLLEIESGRFNNVEKIDYVNYVL